MTTILSYNSMVLRIFQVLFNHYVFSVLFNHHCLFLEHSHYLKKKLYLKQKLPNIPPLLAPSP